MTNIDKPDQTDPKPDAPIEQPRPAENPAPKTDAKK